MKIAVSNGFVELLDVMPAEAPYSRTRDQAVVDAARTSYDGESRSAEEDRVLLRYLYRHKHTSPFEMCELKFRIKAPIFLARQWMRHRTASINEWSGRYMHLPAEQWDQEMFYYQSKSNKQGSGEKHDQSDQVELKMEAVQGRCVSLYDNLIDNQVSMEDARQILPLSTMTMWVWKMDLHNLLHFLKLRLHPHAQHQMRAFAEALATIVKEYFPQTYEAFVDYELEAITLSKPELHALFTGDLSALSKREQSELQEKARVHGLRFPDNRSG